MIFDETAGIRGHLTIIKRDVQTKEETIWFDDHNIIVSGMGYTITEAFTKDCAADIDCAGEIKGVSERSGCSTDAYKINHFQLGTSGSVSREVVTTFSLGNALKESDYGVEPSLLEFHKGNVCSEGTPVVSQSFVGILNKTYYPPNAILHYVILDETACNDITLNEIALFSQNPSNTDALNHHMVSYRAFKPLLKDKAYELIIRWVIYFGVDSADCPEYVSMPGAPA